MIAWPWAGTVPELEDDPSMTIPGHDIGGKVSEEGTMTLTCECGEWVWEGPREHQQHAAEAALRHLAEAIPRETEGQ